jgi:hypothetical protein
MDIDDLEIWSAKIEADKVDEALQKATLEFHQEHPSMEWVPYCWLITRDGAHRH